MTASDVIKVPVLIVGAGPTGLCASLLLSRHGVKSLTVERHPGTSIYPRATGINVRSMEILRSLGLEKEVLRASFTVTARVGTSKTLVDPHPELSPSFREQSSEVSPSEWTSCSQYELEPILQRAAARQPQAQVQFGMELLGFEEGSRGIIARVVNRTTGRISQVHCTYLIAADGSKSLVRERLGIEMHGAGRLMENVNIHFLAPIRQHFPQAPNFIHFVVGDGVVGIFIPTDNESRWVLGVPLEGRSEEPLSGRVASDLIRQAAGLPDLKVEVLGVVPWTMQADSAVRWRAGNIFLAGDAAHRMTPAGGLGMNTGIQDVHNLCWKIAAVSQGWAGPDLLETYEVERMPIGQYNANRSVALIGGAGEVNDRTALDVDLGFTYESTAIIPDGTVKSQQAAGQYVPSARPGSRAPHTWLGSGPGSISTLDLLGPHWTLLSGPGGGGWCQAADAVANEMGVPLRHRMVGCHQETDDRGAAWRAMYGIEETGAVLVRPDGHVAWRQPAVASNQARKLGHALGAVLARTDVAGVMASSSI